MLQHLLPLCCIVVFVSAQGSSKYLLESRGSIQTWGNEVRNRTEFGPDAQKRSWVDGDVILPAGTLQRWKFHHVPRNSPTSLRLQIWRNVGPAHEFTLLYEMPTSLPKEGGYKEVAAEAGVRIPAGGRIGWTLDSDVNPMSYDFLHKRNVYFRTYKEIPQVGLNYTFGELAYPAEYSVALDIDTSPFTPCTAGRFGAGCRFNCHCNNSAICDVTTGTCPHLACAEDFKGVTCQDEIKAMVTTSLPVDNGANMQFLSKETCCTRLIQLIVTTMIIMKLL